MLAIVVAFKEWECMLKTTDSEIMVYNNHKNLEYFACTKILTRRQARWAEHWAEYNYKVVYRPGNKHVKADMLLRHSDNTRLEGSVAQQICFFRLGYLVMDATAVSSTSGVYLNRTFEKGIIRVTQADKNWKATRKVVITRDSNISLQIQV